MAWWRERLEELDQGIAPPAEPRLQAVAETLIPAGVSGSEVSRLEDCWLTLLGPYPWGDAEADAVAERGATLFGMSARLLGRDAAEGEPLGAIWSLAEAAEQIDDEQSRVVLRDRARSAIAALPQERRSTDLAPLTMIAGRRVYELLHGDRGRWHRLVFAFRHALSGDFPRS